MSKISVVIPYMEIDEGKREVLRRCVNSLKGHEELILVWNWKMGYAKPINKGLAIASGDFLIVMNDDVELVEGDLKMLCDENAVTSPKVNGRRQDFWGCVFCIPRWVYEKVGGLDEGYEVSYFDDDDYVMTLKKHGVPMRCVNDVNFITKGGRTLDKFDNRDEFFKKNEKRFKEKWGV